MPLSLPAAVRADESPQGVFQVPCQSQQQFVGRLRSLVERPEQAEALLAEYAVIVLEQAPRAWTLIVTRRGAGQAAPRTVHDASCEALAEVAPLVVSAWIQELPARPTPPAVEPLPPPPTVRFGMALRADAALNLIPGANAGGSVEFVLRSLPTAVRYSFGFSYWALRDQTPLDMRRERYARPIAETYVQISHSGIVLGDFSLGLFVAATLGYCEKDGMQNDHVGFRIQVGGAARWQIDRDWALHYQFGLYFNTSESITYIGPVMSLALEYALI